MRKLKIVFFLEDAETGEAISEKKQIVLGFGDDIEREVVQCSEGTGLIPAFVDSRTPVLKSILEASGLLIGKSLMPLIRRWLGAPDDAFVPSA